MKIMSPVTVLVLTLSCTAALAAGEKMDHGKMDHGKMMENCNKMHGVDVSPADHQRMMDEKFSAIDLDKDGVLSKEEFARHHETMRARHQDDKKDATQKEGHDHASTHKGAG